MTLKSTACEVLPCTRGVGDAPVSKRNRAFNATELSLPGASGPSDGLR
jgi:hypothetical protein